MCAFAALTGLTTAAALIAAGTSASGAFAFGLGLTSVAWCSPVSAVTAQLAEYSRTANGLAGAVLGIAFAVRAVGDSSAEASWLSWLSPLGWATRVRPFAGDRFWVLLIPVVVTAALAVTAYLLQRRRDVGFGLLPTPLGPATAAPRLRTPFALAVRLHRGTLLGWVAGFAVLSVLFGWLASDIGDIVGDNERMRDMLAELGGGRAWSTPTWPPAVIFGMVARSSWSGDGADTHGGDRATGRAAADHRCVPLAVGHRSSRARLRGWGRAVAGGGSRYGIRARRAGG